MIFKVRISNLKINNVGDKNNRFARTLNIIQQFKSIQAVK